MSVLELSRVLNEMMFKNMNKNLLDFVRAERFVYDTPDNLFKWNLVNMMILDTRDNLRRRFAF